jgi:hypothetical protein
MDSHSVSFMLPSGTGEQRVDVPMRSFQGGKYSSRSSEPCELMIAQRLLPSAHRTLRSSRRAIPEVELLIFVFSPRRHSFLRCGTPRERYKRTFCYLPDSNLQRRFRSRGDKCSDCTETKIYHSPTWSRYPPTCTSTSRRLLFLRLIYGQSRVCFLPVATSCLPVAAREELQRAVMGTMGSAHDPARTNIEDGWIRQALAHIYARYLHTALLRGLHSAAE